MSDYSLIDDFHQRNQAAFLQVGSVQLPLHYAEGIDTEIRCLREHFGVMDWKAFDLLCLEGPEAREFIQKMVSNDITPLALGQVQSNLLSNHKGRILSHVEVLYVQEGEYWVLADAGEGRSVGDYLDHYHIREDFHMKLLNPGRVRFDLVGPKALEALQKLGYAAEQHCWAFQEQEVVTAAFALGSLPRFINIVPQEIAVTFLETLSEQSLEPCLAGFEAFDHVRSYEGVPRAGVDYDQTHFPQEASLMDHISYTKGCYVGQETHARMFHRGHPNKQLVAITIPNGLEAKPQDHLFHEGQDVGHITSLSCIESRQGQRGLAWLKYPLVQEGVSLALSAEAEAAVTQQPVATAS